MGDPLVLHAFPGGLGLTNHAFLMPDVSPAILARRYDPSCREFRDGHSYTSWRTDLWRGLEALYGAS